METREKLFEAAISAVAEKGYAATKVDEICTRAGVSKGAFFHYFPNKESLAVAAVNDWTEKCDAMYAAAPYHKLPDPLDRLLSFLDFRKSMLRTPMALISCPVGTMIQEVFESHPEILRACEACISSQVASLQFDIDAAMKRYVIRSQWTPKSLALHIHSLLQGMYILAKASGDVTVAEESMDHLRHYVELLFRQSAVDGKQRKVTKRTIGAVSRSRRIRA